MITSGQKVKNVAIAGHYKADQFLMQILQEWAWPEAVIDASGRPAGRPYPDPRNRARNVQSQYNT